MTGRLKIITAMMVFGSVGIFVKYIDLSSSQIAFLRGLIGSVFLILASISIRQKLSNKATLKRNMKLLILSGAAIGVNWIFLFQAYKYTTVSNATLSYYFAPIFVIILAPFVLKEKLTMVKVSCIITAMIGLFLVLNTKDTSVTGSYKHLVGILYGLSAAIFYAGAILMNKLIKNISGLETTIIQLMVTALVLYPYVFIKEPIDFAGIDSNSLILIFILGILHTGVAYFLYFTSLQELNGQTIAVFSYIDPISAVLMASLFLGESMGSYQVIGGILILGSAFMSERLGDSTFTRCKPKNANSKA
ncbi:MAG: DMT family transporter [Bacillota bacterium]